MVLGAADLGTKTAASGLNVKFFFGLKSVQINFFQLFVLLFFLLHVLLLIVIGTLWSGSRSRDWSDERLDLGLSM